MGPDLPVTILGGYLGAGKTTVLNHLLRTSGEPIAVIVNDFGAVNIDTDLIDARDGDTIALANGCICCSLVDGFGAALDIIRASDPPPQRLVIEASGVADPAQLSAYAHGPGLRLDGVLTVVDAEQVRRQEKNDYIGDVIRMQVKGADLLVLNKIDLVDEPDIERVSGWLRAMTAAAVVPCSDGRVPLSVALDRFDRLTVADGEVDSFKADDYFEAWTEKYDEPLDRADFERRLGELSGRIVRAKGLVRFADEPDVRHVVQVVGPRRSIVADGKWTGGSSTLVFIAVVD